MARKNSHSRKFQDLTGKRFGRWVAIAVSERKPYMRWLVRCDCGTEKTVPACALKNGDTKSCGCLKRELDGRPRPWRVKHQCSREERSRFYRTKYRESGRTNETAREWRKRNQERARALGRLAAERRRVSVCGAPGAGITVEQWREILDQWNGACAYCLGPGREMDHLVPISRGGAHDVENIVPACKSCNSRKHNHSLLRFVSMGGGVV